MRIVFMGTPAFAVPSLRRLVSDFDIVGIISQPDRPRGRGRKTAQPPVKECAWEFGIECIQPEKIRREEVYWWIIGKKPDLIVVVAYGKILPTRILDIPAKGCVNLHPSLLPKLRGAAPMNWSLINGDELTGITVIQMNAAMDAGDIILQEESPIAPEEDYGELSRRLAEEGSMVLLRTLRLIEEGREDRCPQDEREATFAPKIDREMCAIDWHASAREIRDLIRGLTPYPGAHTFAGGKRMKLLKGAVASSGATEILKPGEIAAGGTGKTLLVGTGDGALDIVRLQPEGKRAMSVEEYMRGYQVQEGDVWGEKRP